MKIIYTVSDMIPSALNNIPAHTYCWSDRCKSPEGGVDPGGSAEAEEGQQVDDVGAEQGQGAAAHGRVTLPRVALVQQAATQDPDGEYNCSLV